MVFVNICQNFGNKLFLQRSALTSSFLPISLDLIVVVLALLLLNAYFLTFADVIDPIGQVYDVVGIGRVLADFFELLIILQFSKVVVVLFREVSKVDVGQPSHKIFSVVMQEGQVSKFFPFKFLLGLVVKSSEEGQKHFFQDGFLSIGEFCQFLRLDFADSLFEASADRI